MKKSTLITTIAMIVVVVVALSTATYAWFSTSTSTTANVTMQTTASNDLLLYQGTGTYTEGSGSYTFNSAASSNLNLSNNATLNSGIYAPSSETTLAIAVTGTTATATGSSFFVADNTNKVTTAATSFTPDVFKVANVSGAKKNVVLTVVIDLADTTTTSMYAAAQLRFDAEMVKTSGNAVRITTGYTQAAQTASALILNSTASKKETPVTQTVTGTVPTYNAAASMSDASTYTYFDHVGQTPTTDQIKLGLAADHYYMTYTYTIEDVEKTDSLYFAVYTWIEGWDADLSAANASFAVRYAFTTTAPTTPEV